MAEQKDEWQIGELVTDFIDENYGYDAYEYVRKGFTVTVPKSLVEQLENSNKIICCDCKKVIEQKCEVLLGDTFQSFVCGCGERIIVDAEKQRELVLQSQKSFKRESEIKKELLNKLEEVMNKSSESGYLVWKFIDEERKLND